MCIVQAHLFGDEFHHPLRIRVASSELASCADVVDADDQSPRSSIGLLFGGKPERSRSRAFIIEAVRYRRYPQA